MESLAPVPIIGQKCWFYIDDVIKPENEFEVTIFAIYSYQESAKKGIYKYDNDWEEVVSIPLMDIWINQLQETFWILNPQTDYILELRIPELCPQDVYAARDLEGNWHTFETTLPKQFGILDVTGEIHNKLHQKQIITNT